MIHLEKTHHDVADEGLNFRSMVGEKSFYLLYLKLITGNYLIKFDK